MKRIISLNAQILVASALGIALGAGMHALGTDAAFAKNSLYLASIVSSVFVSSLKMILIPLVFTSLVVGVSQLRSHSQMRQVWKYTLLFFLTTPFVAALTGLVLVNCFEPGKGSQFAMAQEAVATFKADSLSVADFLKQFLSSCFQNPFAAMAQNQVMPVLVFAILTGLVLVRSPEKTKSLQVFFEEAYHGIMVLVGWIMRLAPYGIFALLLQMVASQSVAVLKEMGWFIVTVLTGTLFHGFVTLPLVLKLLTGINPLHFYRNMREPLITAFSTCSSSATMPVTLRCVEEKLGAHPDVSRFVIPLGTTVNMDGTALYEAMAAIFIANVYGIELNFIQQGIVVVTSVLASIGAPGLPSAGMVTMVMVLQSVGLPVEGIALLLPVDRLLDAFRTLVNVEGDAIGTLIVQKYAKIPTATVPKP